MPMSCEWSLPFRLSNWNFVCISIAPMHAACPSNLTLLDLVSLIFSEAYIFWSLSLCSLLLPIPPSYIHIFFSVCCSQTSSFYVLPLMWETKFHAHAKQQVKL
jgi:hypothetical protein